MLTVFSVKMCWSVFVCLCALAIFLQCDASLKLPSFIKPCKRSDPELSKCWRASFENLGPYLKQGIPNIFPPLNNWQIAAKIDIDGGTFVSKVQNVTFIGAENVEILDNTINLQENSLTLTLRYPKIFFEVKAVVNGSILNFQFDGSGIGGGRTDNLVLDYKLKGRRFVHNGEEIITFYNTNVNLQFEKYELTALNVLKTAEENEKFLVEFSKNTDKFKPFLKKILIETIGVAILEILKHAYGTYSLDVLHPLE